MTIREIITNLQQENDIFKKENQKLKTENLKLKSRLVKTETELNSLKKLLVDVDEESDIESTQVEEQTNVSVEEPVIKRRRIRKKN